jgi:ribosomal protein S18 acetylase RimI-like enzyme
VIEAAGTVRRATGADVPQLAEALARAFFDDPLFKWMFRRDSTRLFHLRRYFAHRLRLLLAQQQVYTTDTAVGAALWARPNEWRDPPGAALRQMVALTPALGLRLRRSVRAMSDVERRHPRPAHWYLAVLGIDPDRQRRGLGSALLAPVLAACDRDRMPAYLETSRERNVAFYRRRGFQVVDSLTLPEGPPIWLMWRDPAA